MAVRLFWDVIVKGTLSDSVDKLDCHWVCQDGNSMVHCSQGNQTAGQNKRMFLFSRPNKHSGEVLGGGGSMSGWSRRIAVEHSRGRIEHKCTRPTHLSMYVCTSQKRIVEASGGRKEVERGTLRDKAQQETLRKGSLTVHFL